MDIRLKNNPVGRNLPEIKVDQQSSMSASKRSTQGDGSDDATSHMTGGDTETETVMSKRTRRSRRHTYNSAKSNDLQFGGRSGKFFSMIHNTHAKVEDMALRIGGNFRRKKFSTKVNRDDAYLLKVYKEIIEYDPTSKVKAKNLKVTKPQIVKFLRKRYGPRQVDKIMNTFKFPNSGKFEDYCNAIQDFI